MTGKIYALRSAQQGAGRSVIAANLAFELASTGSRTVLVDLDHEWPSLHRYFNLPKQQASVLAAVRLFGQGKLDANAMEDITVRLLANGVSIDFLSGFRLGEHIKDIAPNALVGFLDFLRNRFDAVVLDCPAGLEAQVLAPMANLIQNNIWVTQIDPISLGRFVDAHEARELSQQRIDTDVLVLNRMRASVLGARPEWQVQQVLRDRTHFRRAIVIPDDPIFDQALLKGLPLRQISGKSKPLAAVSELAARLQ